MPSCLIKHLTGTRREKVIQTDLLSDIHLLDDILHAASLVIILSKSEEQRRCPDCADAQAGLQFVVRIQQKSAPHI